MRIVALAVVALLVAGCTSPPPPTTPTPTGPAPTPRPVAGFNPLVKLGTDEGDLWLEVFEEMVPVTAQNFLTYARNGFYEGIKVHRVVGPAQQPPDGFVIQMGDPNTRDATKPRTTWGQGDPSLPTIPDEFHPALRHDAAGIVSMANAGPNSGSSQFFITLAPTPSLDDRHTVFGKVVAGMDKVRAIAGVALVGEVPAEDIVIRSTEVLEPQRDPAQVRHSLGASTMFPVVNTTLNHTIGVGVVLHNTGNVRETLDLGVEVPANWSAAAVWPPDLRVAAGMSQVMVLIVSTPENATFGDHPVTVKVNASGAQAAVTFTAHLGTLGKLALGGSKVTVHYTGTMPDGRLFDADRWEVVSNASIPKFVGGGQKPGQFTPRPQNSYTPLAFEIGGPGLIQGFNEGAFRLREGELRTIAVPPEGAYGSSGHPLSGRTLLFTIELLKVG